MMLSLSWLVQLQTRKICSSGRVTRPAAARLGHASNICRPGDILHASCLHSTSPFSSNACCSCFLSPLKLHSCAAQKFTSPSGVWSVECAVLARCSTYGLYGQRCVMTYSRVLFSFQVWLGRGVSRRARPGKSSPPIFWWEHLGTTLLNNNFFFFYKMRNITKLICKQTYSPPWLPKAEGTLYIWYKNRYLSSIAYQSSMSKILLK
jgi:hypothetical protein